MERNRKRSLQVAAPLLASAALSLMTVGCETQPKRCVDEHNMVVDPSFCQATQSAGQNGSYGTHYHYYYGGSGGYSPGTYVTGGAYTPTPGVSYSGTSRGGFGGSAGDGGGGHGGGGGGE